MSIVHEIILQCPICGSWFRSAALEENGDRSRTSTDFHHRVSGPDPVAYLVHACAVCGFAGPREEFATDEVSGASAGTLARRDAVIPSSRDVPASDRYEAAALVAELRGDGPMAVAERLLRAAWCCIAEHDTEAERFFRRQAAMAYERALARFDDVPRERRAEITYLVGEQWRRIGDGDRARIWLDRVAGEVVNEETQRWLVELAAQQRDQPREWLIASPEITRPHR